MPRKKKTEEQPSIADLAKKGLQRIVELSQSQLISEKLQSIDILLFVMIATVCLTYFLGGSTMDGFSLIVVGVLCFVAALIGVLGYAPLLSIPVNASPNKIETLRIGITILFISLPLSVAALVFNISFLATLSLGLIGLQLLIMLVSCLFVPKDAVKDGEIEPSQIWIALGRVSSIVGIINFAIDLVLIVLKISI